MKLFVIKQGISTIDEVEELKRLTLKDGLDGLGLFKLKNYFLRKIK